MTITEPTTRPFGAQLTAITLVANTAHTLRRIREELLEADRRHMHHSAAAAAAMVEARGAVVDAEERVRDVLTRMVHDDR